MKEICFQSFYFVYLLAIQTLAYFLDSIYTNIIL